MTQGIRPSDEPNRSGLQMFPFGLVRVSVRAASMPAATHMRKKKMTADSKQSMTLHEDFSNFGPVGHRGQEGHLCQLYMFVGLSDAHTALNDDITNI